MEEATKNVDCTATEPWVLLTSTHPATITTTTVNYVNEDNSTTVSKDPPPCSTFSRQNRGDPPSIQDCQQGSTTKNVIKAIQIAMLHKYYHRCYYNSNNDSNYDSNNDSIKNSNNDSNCEM